MGGILETSQGMPSAENQRMTTNGKEKEVDNGMALSKQLIFSLYESYYLYYHYFLLKKMALYLFILSPKRPFSVGFSFSFGKKTRILIDWP